MLQVINKITQAVVGSFDLSKFKDAYLMASNYSVFYKQEHIVVEVA